MSDTLITIITMMIKIMKMSVLYAEGQKAKQVR